MKVIVDTQGRAIVNASGQLQVERPLSTVPIQEGLFFWGNADPANLTLVDGFASEAKDVRGNGKKMVQTTATRRLKYTEKGLLALHTVEYAPCLGIAAQNARSMFIVINAGNVRASVGNSHAAIGTNLGGVGLGIFNPPVATYTSGSFYQNLHLNKTSITANSIVILHSLADFNQLYQTIYIGGAPSVKTEDCIMEWGIYDILLTESQTIYNENALITYYQQNGYNVL